MDLEEKIDWLKLHGFKLANSYNGSNNIWALYLYYREIQWEDSLFFLLRVKIDSNDSHVVISLLLKDRNYKTLEVSVFSACLSVDSPEDMQSLIDKGLDFGIKLMEKGFGRLSEYRMTGM